MIQHLKWEMLNDFADDVLPVGPRAQAVAHLEVCSDCRGTLARLRSVLALASALPRTIEPPDAVWPRIRASIERTKSVSIDRRSAFGGRTIAFAAIAAAILVIVSSAVTKMVIQRRPTPVIAESTPLRPEGRALALPADFVAAEREYLTTARELETAVQEAEAYLAPATLQTIRHNLGIIDAAIREARQALVDDPGSAVIRDILARNYQRKLEFLRRTSALNLGTL